MSENRPGLLDPRFICAVGAVAFAAGACGAQPRPGLPGPGDADVVGGGVEATQAGDIGGIVPADADSQGADELPDQAPQGIEPVVEDPIEPEPVDEDFRGPSDEEIDRVLREMLGSDPIGLVRSPDEAASELPLEMNDRVEAWINYFENVIPERFQLYLERTGRYEDMIRRKLRERGMPQDLLYLAVIESGMNPRAYSRAAAVGMWQFIRSTGRLYGLEVSFWVDERRDPEKSTDAALRYLSDLHEQFGSWYLAAAAYNGGPGRVRRGLARTDGGTFWDLADRRLLRSETRNYVPKLIAAALIGRDPARYGFREIRPHDPLRWETVTVPDATSFDVLAEAAGVDQETISDLNPQFPQRVTPPGRAVELRVPPGTAETFATRYAAIPPDKRVTWTYHIVRRGQTLGGIGREYGVSVSALRAANGNVNPRRLRIGQRLLIPKPGRLASAAPARSSSASSARASSARSSSASSAPASAGEARLEAAGPVTVVVRRGDSLWTIARRYSVSTRQLMEWNGLRSTVIRPGDRLEIRRAESGGP